MVLRTISKGFYMYHTYKEIEEAIKHLRPFTGNCSSGKIIEDKLVIKSYDTIIARIGAEGGLAYFNSDKYSRTTKRLQNLILKYYNP